jgi:hypothetical protein
MTREQQQAERVVTKYAKAASVVTIGVLIVGALYFGLIYMLTAR